MPCFTVRSCFALSLVLVLTLAPESWAFQTPLSDQAVREAYFLGQRHDETFARFLDGYTQHLAFPPSGPFIESVSFYTPFALLVEQSSQRAEGYSAQQALSEHRDKKESVRVIVQILLTDSYGPLIPAPAGGRASQGLTHRAHDFWKDFEVRIFNGDHLVKAQGMHGEPTFSCNNGGCLLSGAVLYFDFPASTFDANSAAVEVYPPEAEALAVDFDIASLR